MGWVRFEAGASGCLPRRFADPSLRRRAFAK